MAGGEQARSREEGDYRGYKVDSNLIGPFYKGPFNRAKRQITRGKSRKI